MVRLQIVRGQLRPFEAVFEGIDAFLSPKRVLYLVVESTDGLLATRHKLLETLALCQFGEKVYHNAGIFVPDRGNICPQIQR